MPNAVTNYLCIKCYVMRHLVVSSGEPFGMWVFFLISFDRSYKTKQTFGHNVFTKYLSVKTFLDTSQN